MVLTVYQFLTPYGVGSNEGGLHTCIDLLALI
jgi:hypothetical protein